VIDTFYCHAQYLQGMNFKTNENSEKDMLYVASLKYLFTNQEM
jgi:hypothetical protein